MSQEDFVLLEKRTFSGSNFNGYTEVEVAPTLLASDHKRAESNVVIERRVNSMYGESIAPTVTASGSDFIGLCIPMVSVHTTFAEKSADE